jgi:RNA polymerase sigma factor (sigma-70 family)
LRIPLSTARRFIAGDEKAATEVYLSSRKLLYFIIRSIVIGKEDADDIYQDVFVRILQNRSAIRSPNHLERYLAATAKNMALNYVHRRASLIDYAESMDGYEGDDRPNAYLQSFFPFLTARENAVLVYKLEYGFSLREIGTLMDISRQTADVAYKRAIQKIKKNL